MAQLKAGSTVGGKRILVEGDVTSSANAETAAKLKTARTVRTNLASTSSASFDGTANITPGVTGVLPVANGGTGKSSLTDTAYTTNKYRGISMQTSTPSSIPNGCIVLVYS